MKNEKTVLIPFVISCFILFYCTDYHRYLFLEWRKKRRNQRKLHSPKEQMPYWNGVKYDYSLLPKSKNKFMMKLNEHSLHFNFMFRNVLLRPFSKELLPI